MIDAKTQAVINAHIFKNVLYREREVAIDIFEKGDDVFELATAMEDRGQQRVTTDALGLMPAMTVLAKEYMSYPEFLDEQIRTLTALVQ